MKQYLVIAEYGIQQGDYLERKYWADNERSARARFIRVNKPNINPVQWNNMKNNIRVREA